MSRNARWACLLVVVAVAGMAPATAAAGGASKRALHARFDHAVSTLARGDFKAFCRTFTRASLRRFGGVAECARGVREQAARLNLQAAAAGLVVRSVTVSGSAGTVRWRAAGRKQQSPWRYERGRWRMTTFLGGAG